MLQLNVRAAVGLDSVVAANPREDLIAHAEVSPLGRDKRPTLRHDLQQRHLPQEDRLATL